MNKVFTIRIHDGSTTEARGIDAPVPGLAVVSVVCDCCESLQAILHVRSGTALMFSHCPESFGAPIWERLRHGNWLLSAEEINGDYATIQSSIEAMAVARGDVYLGRGADTLEDVAAPEDMLSPMRRREPEHA